MRRLLRPKDLLGVNFVKHFNLPYLFETREPRRVCGVVTFRDCELSQCVPIASPLSSSQPGLPPHHTPGRFLVAPTCTCVAMEELPYFHTAHLPRQSLNLGRRRAAGRVG